MRKKNFPEKVGEYIPGYSIRTPRENRLVGTVALITAVIVGPSLLENASESISKAATNTETVCVTTNGAPTEWGNAAEAQDKLIEKGVNLPDTGEVAIEIDTTDPVVVCGDKRIGVLSNIVGMLPIVDANITAESLSQTQTS